MRCRFLLATLAAGLISASSAFSSTLEVIYTAQSFRSGNTPDRQLPVILTLRFATDEDNTTQFFGSDLVFRDWQNTLSLGAQSQVDLVGLFPSALLTTSEILYQDAKIGNTLQAVGTNGKLAPGTVLFEYNPAPGEALALANTTIRASVETGDQIALRADWNKDGFCDECRYLLGFTSAVYDPLARSFNSDEDPQDELSAVPLPASAPLMLAGFAGLAFARRRKWTQRT